MRGANRRNVDREFLALGGSIRRIARTGELLYSHPLLKERQRINARRKDAPRHLVTFVEKVQKAIATTSQRHSTDYVRNGGPDVY